MTKFTTPKHLDDFEVFVLDKPCLLEKYIREASPSENFAFDCKDVVHIGGVKVGRLFDVSPNPCREILEVKFHSKFVNLQEMNWTLKDMNGRTIVFLPKDVTAFGKRMVLNISDLSNGIYFLQVAIGGEKQAWKIIKTE